MERAPQGVTCFQAKVGEANAASLHLFKRLGYVEASRSRVFRVRSPCKLILKPPLADKHGCQPPVLLSSGSSCECKAACTALAAPVNLLLSFLLENSVQQDPVYYVVRGAAPSWWLSLHAQEQAGTVRLAVTEAVCYAWHVAEQPTETWKGFHQRPAVLHGICPGDVASDCDFM